MLETLQGDLGCNRRVEGLCLLPAGAFRSQVEFGYISPHFVSI